jgi:hypothetical protein
VPASAQPEGAASASVLHVQLSGQARQRTASSAWPGERGCSLLLLTEVSRLGRAPGERVSHRTRREAAGRRRTHAAGEMDEAVVVVAGARQQRSARQQAPPRLALLAGAAPRGPQPPRALDRRRLSPAARPGILTECSASPPLQQQSRRRSMHASHHTDAAARSDACLEGRLRTGPFHAARCSCTSSPRADFEAAPPPRAARCRLRCVLPV